MRANQLGILFLILLLGGCGPTESEATSATAGEDQARPNETAMGIVRAFGAADCGFLVTHTTGLIHDYFVTLNDVHYILIEIVQFFEGLYPDESDSKDLQKLRDSWRKPMTSYKDLQVDGMLSSSDPDRGRRFRVSWDAGESARHEDVLTLTKVEGRWLLSSMGKVTPNTAMIANLRTQLNALQFSFESALDVVKEASPQSLREGLVLFHAERAKIVEGG